MTFPLWAAGIPCPPLNAPGVLAARGLPVALFFSLFSLHMVLGGESSAPPASDPAAEAYRRGVEFLVSSQNKNGSWGSFESARPDEVLLGTSASYQAFGDGSSALCVLALLAPSHYNQHAFKALEAGVGYLLKTAPPLRATDKVLYNVWAHIYVLEALSAVLLDKRFAPRHDDARRIAALHIGELGRLQGAEGGFGYYDFKFASSHPTGSESTSFMTAAALLALDRAKAAGLPVPERMTQDALKSLERMRLGTGAYIYGTYIEKAPQHPANQVKGSLGRSQPCNLALWRARTAGLTADDLKRGLQTLFDQHHFIAIGKGRPWPHEGWYSTAGYYFLFGHYYAARVARELPAADQKKYRQALAAILIRLQDKDGSWWDFPLYGYYKAYGTAFALLTLEP